MKEIVAHLLEHVGEPFFLNDKPVVDEHTEVSKHQLLKFHTSLHDRADHKEKLMQ